jgi:hypothetical protein
MIEVGKLSPIGVVCDGKVTIELSHMMSPKNFQLLTRLFNDQEDMSPYQKELMILDQYLDIPFVEAYFNPTSFKAFCRLVENGCTQYPSTVTSVSENLPFCICAAEANKLDVLQKAYDIGCHLNSHVLTKWAFTHGNKDMLLFLMDHGQVNLNHLDWFFRVPNVQMVQMVLDHGYKFQFTYYHLYSAARGNDLNMLLLIDRQDLITDRTVLANELGEAITSIEVLKCMDTYFSHLMTANDYNEVMKYAAATGDLDLLDVALDMFSSTNSFVDTYWFYDVSDVKVMRYLMNNIEWSNVEWNAFVVNFLSHEDILQYLLSHEHRVIMPHAWEAIAEAGRLDIMEKWNPVLHSSMLAKAINGNQLAMVKYLVERKCPWPEGTLMVAEKNYFQVLRYIHEQGYPCNGSCRKFYHPNKILFCQ